MSKPSTNQQTNERYLQLLQGSPTRSVRPSVRSVRQSTPPWIWTEGFLDESNKEIRFARKNQPFNGNGKRRTRTAQNCRFNSYELSLLNWKDPAQCHFLIALTLEKVRPFTGTSWPDYFLEMRNFERKKTQRKVMTTDCFLKRLKELFLMSSQSKKFSVLVLNWTN